MAMCPLSGPTVTSPHPTVLTPLRLRAALRGVQRSRRLHHLPLQLLEGVGVRPHTWEDLGEAGPGSSGGGGRSGVGGERLSEWRGAAPARLRSALGSWPRPPPSAVRSGMRGALIRRGTQPSPPSGACPGPTHTPSRLSH